MRKERMGEGVFMAARDRCLKYRGVRRTREEVQKNSGSCFGGSLSFAAGFFFVRHALRIGKQGEAEMDKLEHTKRERNRGLCGMHKGNPRGN